MAGNLTECTSCLIFFLLCFFSSCNFSDIDGVLRRANATEYGLASGVLTRDLSKALYVSEKLQAGTVFVNTYNKTDVAAPFGGFKQSGFGKDLGNYGSVKVSSTHSIRFLLFCRRRSAERISQDQVRDH